MEDWQHRKKTHRLNMKSQPNVTAVLPVRSAQAHGMARDLSFSAVLPLWSLVQSDPETVLSSGTCSPKPVRNQQIFGEIERKEGAGRSGPPMV